MSQGFQTGLQGHGQAGSLFGQQAQIQQQASNSGVWGSLGGVAGSMLSAEKAPWIFSDRNMKEDIEPVDPEKALDAVRETPVSNWAYKEGLADDGAQLLKGPMAQDVNRTMGEKAAPAGKMLDTIRWVASRSPRCRPWSRGSVLAAAVGMDLEPKKRPVGRALPAAAAGMV